MRVKGRNYIIISGFLVAFLAGTIISAPQVSAANPVLTFLQDVIEPLLNSINGLLTDSIFGLEEIKNEVRDIESDVTSPIFGLEKIKNAVAETEPLSQLKILDFQTTINSDFDATSDKQFIVEACGFAQDPLASLTVFRDDTSIASIIAFHNIGNNPLDGACTTVGGNPNDKIILRYEADLPGGGTIMGGTMMLRTTPSAVASIIPSP